MNYIHVANVFRTTNKDDSDRMDRAQKTWAQLRSRYPHHLLQVYNTTFERSALNVGDKRPVPFVKDVINAVEAQPEDIVFLTNADSSLVRETLEVLGERLITGGVCWSSRYDMDKPHRTWLSIPEVKMRGTPHKGLDLLAFRWDWWLETRDSWPDSLLGYEGWDAVFAVKLGKTLQVGPLVYHEMHQTPYWMQHRKVAPGNLYNRSVIRKWLDANNLFAEACAIWPGVREYKV